ncbi:MAG: BTAD domain-containing putative transcriptional regulator, partial [Gemmatimonadota bacterium]|nr:BTAD domain-containing putative transcriptional regulator [Gemmatimonadota bacterium]
NERRHLRTRARRAACELADAAETSDPEAAALFARRAIELEPTYEPAARQLIRILGATGNRAGAVAAYEELEETLNRVLEMEPAVETRELIEGIRRGATPGSPDADRAADGSHPDPVDPGTDGDAAGRTGDPRRVLVRPFENLTGDADLDVLGRMVVDWVSRGLSELPELDVVPPAGDSVDPAPEAGTIVSGRYYRDDSELILQAHLADVSNDRLLPGPDPVIVSADEPLAGLDEITRRIAAILAPALNPRAIHVYHGARPPNFEVYRAYMEGLEAFIAGDWAEASDRLRRCAEAAPDYALPRIVRAIAAWNLGRLHEAAEITEEAAALRDTVGRFERSVIDTVRAWLKGDWTAAQEAVRLQAHMAPGSIPNCQVAEEARRLNRLHEARNVLRSLDPERGELRGWIHYWVELTTVLHLLGDHDAELEAALRARRIHDDVQTRWLEIRALVAPGRTDDVGRRIEEALTLSGDRYPRPGRLLHDTARESWRHGHDVMAAEMLDRSLSWFAAHASGRFDRLLQRDHARALFDARELEAAERIFRRLVETAPPGEVQSISGHHGHLRGHLDEGYLAAIARRRGDEEETERRRRQLEAMDRRFLFGADRLWLGILLILDGEQAAAVSEIRRAFSDGLPFGLHLHADPNLAPLRENPRFRALVRPRETSAS